MKGAIILLMIVGLSTADLDLKRSISRIQDQIELTKTNIPDWTKLPEIIGKVMPCLINGIELFEVEDGKLPSKLEEYIENISPAQFAEELLKVDWAEISAKRSTAEQNPSDVWEDLKEFMNTTKFETIHRHIWDNVEFRDLLDYIHSANYPDIYTTIKKFYEDFGRTDLSADVDAKPSPPPRTIQTAKQPTSNVASSNFPIITMKSTIFKADDPKCDLTYLLEKVLGSINKSNIHEVIKIFFYTLQEFIGNAAMHVLAMKMSETQKGEFFHTTLALPEMEEFLPFVQSIILSEPGFAQLNDILRLVTGLDIGNLELFKYITNLLEYLIWNYPFPANA